jgi:hypothetical protein
MKSTELRQLIRESINEYIREIDEAGNVAALEAKMTKTQEAIELREKKMNMDGLDEAYHDMLDKGKVKELGNEVKALKKSLVKYEKQLEKLKSKGAKIEKPESEEKEIVDEAFPESQLEENEGSDLNSMSDYDLMSYAEDEGMEDMIVRDGEGGLANREEIIATLSEGNNLSSTNQIYERLLLQKKAGIITESQYIAKLKEQKKLNEEKAVAWTVEEEDGLPRIRGFSSAEEAEDASYDEMKDDDYPALVIYKFEDLKNYLEGQYDIFNMEPYLNVKSRYGGY